MEEDTFERVRQIHLFGAAGLLYFRKIPVPDSNARGGVSGKKSFDVVEKGF